MDNIKNQNGFSIVGIILALAIVALLYYLSINYYLKGPSVDNKTKQELAEQGINTNSYMGVTKTANEKVKDFNKKSGQLENELQQKME